MITRTMGGDFVRAMRAVRPVRLAVLLLGAVAAGLAADGLRADGRLVFPRPLPVFTPTPPAR